MKQKFSITGWPTVRRHPRSLAEAFPGERAEWSEGWQGSRARLSDLLLDAAFAVFCGILIGGGIILALS